MSEHYFSVRPAAADRRKRFRARVWGHELALESAAGVFSHGRFDLGTQVLVRSASPRPASRTVLDLGCGSGVLAIALGLARPDAQVWAVDVNERARELTAVNGAAYDLSGRLHVTGPDATGPDVTGPDATGPDGVPADVAFDEIWSNPPIRIGKAAVHELLLRWLPRLAPGGRAVLVIGRNLGADSYQRWLVEQGWSCRRLASAKGFRVLEVSAVAAGPGRAPPPAPGDRR